MTKAKPKTAPVLKLVNTSPLPKLIVHGPDLPATARAAAAMLARRPHMFEYGGVPVRLVRGVDGLRIQPLTFDSLANEIHAIAQPVKYTNDGEREMTIPERACRLLLALKPKELKFRPLAGLTHAPLIRGDGTIRTTDGYDDETGFFCDHLSDLKLAVPERPTREHAAAALMKLREPLRYFPFEDADKVDDPVLGEPAVDLTTAPGQDETAALLAIVTAVARRSLEFAPGFANRAPRGQGSGAGKGFLARAACITATGREPTAAPGDGDAAEAGKRITAALLDHHNDGIVYLDNLNGVTLKSNTLSSALTEHDVKLRVFGTTTLAPAVKAPFVIATGNALDIAEDLVRKFVIGRLNPETENPEQRPFNNTFPAEIKASRGELLTAVLTIIRWGLQNPNELKRGKPLGTFTQWAAWIRDPLLTLGCADPVENIAAAKRADPDRLGIAVIFEVWFEHHGTAKITAATLNKDVKELLDPNERGRQYLAAAVRKLAKTRVAGFVLHPELTDGKWSATKYWLERTNESATGAHATLNPEPPPREAGCAHCGRSDGELLLIAVGGDEPRWLHHECAPREPAPPRPPPPQPTRRPKPTSQPPKSSTPRRKAF